MVEWKGSGVIGGGEHGAKGLERLWIEVDRVTGRSANPVFGRPSTYLNLGIGVAGVVVPVLAKLRPPSDNFLTSFGWHMTTKAWDYIEEILTAPAAARGVPPRGVPPRGAPPAPAKILA